MLFQNNNTHESSLLLQRGRGKLTLRATTRGGGFVACGEKSPGQIVNESRQDGQIQVSGLLAVHGIVTYFMLFLCSFAEMSSKEPDNATKGKCDRAVRDIPVPYRFA